MLVVPPDLASVATQVIHHLGPAKGVLVVTRAPSPLRLERTPRVANSVRRISIVVVKTVAELRAVVADLLERQHVVGILGVIGELNMEGKHLNGLLHQMSFLDKVVIGEVEGVIGQNPLIWAKWTSVQGETE